MICHSFKRTNSLTNERTSVAVCHVVAIITRVFQTKSSFESKYWFYYRNSLRSLCLFVVFVFLDAYWFARVGTIAPLCVGGGDRTHKVPIVGLLVVLSVQTVTHSCTLSLSLSLVHVCMYSCIASFLLPIRSEPRLLRTQQSSLSFLLPNTNRLKCRCRQKTPSCRFVLVLFTLLFPFTIQESPIPLLTPSYSFFSSSSLPSPPKRSIMFS